MSEHKHEWHATGYTMPEYACECGVSEHDATKERIHALEAENARMRAVVEATAKGGLEVHGDFRTCTFCRHEIDTRQHPDWQERFQHTADCPVTIARAILASASDTTEGR